MQICKDHWAAMRAEVKARGLDHLVAKSGKAAADSMMAELNQTADPAMTFDPLMNANFAITAQFLESVPVGERLSAFSADVCPLCCLSPKREGTTPSELADNWIKGSIQDQYGQAVELGLVDAATFN